MNPGDSSPKISHVPTKGYSQSEPISLGKGVRLRELPSRGCHGRLTAFCSLRQRVVGAYRKGLSEVQSAGSTELEGIPEIANTLAQQNGPSRSLLAGTALVSAACSLLPSPRSKLAVFASDTCWVFGHLEQATDRVAFGSSQGLGAASAAGSLNVYFLIAQFMK